MNAMAAFRETMQGKKATLVGLGKSNLAAADFLLSCGMTLTARDKNPNLDEGTASFLKERGIAVRLGEDYLSELTEDVILRAPAVRRDISALLEAEKRGVMLTSETELFTVLCPCPIYAVTGSDGKTTTTTLLGELLKRAVPEGARVYVGGNIGTPLLPLVGEMTERDYAVMELSSFQLQTMHFSPAAAVVTNVTPNHLNWHCDMDEYIECKKNIYRNQNGGRLVLNFDNPVTREMAKEADGEVVWFSSDPEAEHLCKGRLFFLRDGNFYLQDEEGTHFLMERRELLLPAKHNAENFMAALAAVFPLVGVPAMRETARTFHGVAHRLELVTERDGVTYYNSSIDTSPTRTAAALSAFAERVIVIVGGYDKHLPLAPLTDALLEKAKYTVATGDTGKAVLAVLEKAGYPKGNMRYFPAFTDAVHHAMAVAKRGDRVLLSPAAASFDAFKNFEERGLLFCEIVKNTEK